MAGKIEKVGDGWKPIRFEFSKAAGPMNWSAGIKILAHHNQPDLASPSGAGLFVNRHVNPHTRTVEFPLVQRNDPGMDETPEGASVSVAAMPGGEIYREGDGKTAHQRDWDFICQERDKVLAKHGLLKSKDLLKKVKVLADYVQSRRGGDEKYPSRHPSDFLLHSSYCTGTANAIAGVLTTLGLRVRRIDTQAHSTAEVQIDGNWRFVENTKESPITFLPDKSFMEVCAFPERLKNLNMPIVEEFYANYDLSGDDFIYSGSAYQLGCQRWHFNQCGVGKDGPINSQSILGGFGVGVGLDGTTARFLYPNEKNICFRATRNGACMIAGKYSWWRSPMQLKPGQSVRRVFYLGALNDSKNPLIYLEAQVMLAPDEKRRFAADGKGFFLKVNDTIYPLDKGVNEWKYRRAVFNWQHRRVDCSIPAFYKKYNRSGRKQITEESLNFTIDKKDLRENAMNCIEFGCSAGGNLPVIMFPDLTEPYYAPVKGGSLQPRWEIQPDHICEVLQVRHGYGFPAKRPCVVTL